MRSRGLLAGLVLLAACGAPQSEGNPWMDYLRSSSPSRPEHGTASLGRHIRDVSELARFAHGVTEGCEEPLPVTVDRVAPLLPDGVPPLVIAAAVCRGGYGDVLITLADGAAREVQERYRAAIAANRTLWTRNDFTPLFGNGFMVIVKQHWFQRSYSLAGLRFLRCGEDSGPEYNSIVADADGCVLSTEAMTP